MLFLYLHIPFREGIGLQRETNQSPKERLGTKRRTLKITDPESL